MKKLLIVLALLAILATPSLLVAAQANVPADWTNLQGVLVWLAGVGAVYAVGWIVANFLEKMDWWNKLPPSVKWVIPPVLSVVVAFLSQLLLKQEIILAQLQPYFALIVMVLLNYLGLQAGHNATRQARLKG